ncbi:MAG: phosphotransferase [Planctomycetia bacterium]|nr:phosphotransferase [Planctomycetia bacterium]
MDTIERILREVPELAEPHSVTPLGGGITNRNYRVESKGGAFVLRVAGEDTALLGIDRDREHACARAAAAVGVGAEVIAYLPHHAALVTRFVEGRVLSVKDAAASDVLARAVRSLRTYHRGPAVPGEFSAFRTIRDYHRLAVERRVPMSADVPRALAELAAIERALGPPEALRPCHNDLLPSNLIDDGTGVRIIDWEYAAMGDPFFDLGNFAENHLLSPAQEEELLRLYFGTARLPDRGRLAMMRRVSALREATWGFAQTGISKLDFDFLAYAEQHLRRFRP